MTSTESGTTTAKAPTGGLVIEDNESLTRIQADAILAMTLSRLTGLERDKLEEEYKALAAEIADLMDILAHDKRVLDIIKKDLAEIKEKHGDERRTEIQAAGLDEFDITDLIPDEQMVVTLSAEALAVDEAEFRALYRTEPPQRESATLTALPYYLWANRGQGSMMIWIPEA